jgi:uncharacterized protein YbaR (Trm112 family)
MSEIDSRLLEVLCCPITRRPLQRLGADALAQVNAAMAAGKLRNHGGADITVALDAALVTSEGDLIYPVRSGRPVLLEEECIHWAALKD